MTAPMTGVSRPAGWLRRPEAVARVLARLPGSLFAASAAELRGSGEDRDVFLWEACRRVTGAHLPAHDQDGVGCCVGEGFASAVEYLQCVEIALKGEPQEYAAISCESIYGLSRVEVGGGRLSGDGSVGAWAAEAVSRHGVLPRRKLAGSGGREYDLTKFDPRRAREWGARGLPDDLEPTARRHLVRTAGLVRSFAQARDALANGYPVAVCSDQGFASERDRDGFCAPRGQWMHAMCFIGVTAGRRPGLCCLQSWGPNTPAGPVGVGDHPDCSFWVDAAVAERMLRQGDSWALSAFDGFPPREIDWRV